jgi:hypothetical protein
MQISDEAFGSRLRVLIDQSLAGQETREDREPQGGGAPQNFCAVWPIAKPILRDLSTAATGAGSLVHPLGIAGPMLIALVAAGELAYQATCRGTKSE